LSGCHEALCAVVVVVSLKKNASLVRVDMILLCLAAGFCWVGTGPNF
jgi:hypothetical protein